MKEMTPTLNKKVERNSAFEILRIIAIIFIIAHHFSNHGGFSFGGLEQTSLIIFNKTWIDFIAQLGKVGVNLFVLISGFYLIDNTHFKIKKLLSLVLQMLIFSIVIGVIFLIKDKGEFNTLFVKQLLFPVGREAWWYMTFYLLMYLFSPLLNLGIKAMNKKMHLVFIVILVVIWSLLPTLIGYGYGFSNFGWFITLYLIASCIKLYDVKLKIKPWLGILLSVGIFLIWFFIKFAINLHYEGGKYIVNRILTWFNLININNFVQLVSVLILFVAFKEIKMRSIKFINLIASTTLTVYLIHDHGDIRHYLWIDLFKNASYASSPNLFIYSIGVILLVFVICVILGLIYRYSIGLGINKFLNILDKKCLYKVDNIFNNKASEE